MTSREEIVLALKYFFDVETEASVHEIIGQESDPVDTIAAALDEYRKVDSCEGWIKCSERMPERTDDIIVVSEGIVMSGISYSRLKGFYIAALEYDEDEKIDGVTHWQLLPEPPQESNDDKS